MQIYRSTQKTRTIAINEKYLIRAKNIIGLYSKFPKQANPFKLHTKSYFTYPKNVCRKNELTRLKRQFLSMLLVKVREKSVYRPNVLLNNTSLVLWCTPANLG